MGFCPWQGISHIAFHDNEWQALRVELHHENLEKESMNTLSKILLVGAFPDNPAIYTYALSFNTALQKLGYHVDSFNYRNKIFPGPFARFNNIAINKALIKKVAATKPDLIFLVKAENITTETLAFIKKNLCHKIINFYPDNPFALWNGNSNHEVLTSLPLLSCFLSWSQMLTPSLQSAGCANVCSFPFGYDEEIFLSTQNTFVPDEKKYAADVCFVGTWEPMREQWLAELVDRMPNITLAIWGNDWHKKCHSAKLTKSIRGDAIYNNEMIQAFRASKIVLNFIRVQNMTSHNMRTFEVPASNTFLLTQHTYEQAELYFKAGVSIACFVDADDLANKVAFYLQHEGARHSITQKGFEQAQNFTLTKQLQNYFNNCPHLHS